MRYLLFVLLILVGAKLAWAQPTVDSMPNSLSIVTGATIFDEGTGLFLQACFEHKLYKKFRLGYNLVHSSSSENIETRLFSIDNGFIFDGYEERLQQRVLSFGLSINYDIIRNMRNQLTVGFGPNINQIKYLDARINGLDGNNLVSFYEIDEIDLHYFGQIKYSYFLSAHLGLSFYTSYHDFYGDNLNIGVGLTSRF